MQLSLDQVAVDPGKEVAFGPRCPGNEHAFQEVAGMALPLVEVTTLPTPRLTSDHPAASGTSHFRPSSSTRIPSTLL